MSIVHYQLYRKLPAESSLALLQSTVYQYVLLITSLCVLSLTLLLTPYTHFPQVLTPILCTNPPFYRASNCSLLWGNSVPNKCIWIDILYLTDADMFVVVGHDNTTPHNASSHANIGASKVIQVIVIP